MMRTAGWDFVTEQPAVQRQGPQGPSAWPAGSPGNAEDHSDDPVGRPRKVSAQARIRHRRDLGMGPHVEVPAEPPGDRDAGPDEPQCRFFRSDVLAVEPRRGPADPGQTPISMRELTEWS